MNGENSFLDDVTKNLDDSGLTLSYGDWIAQLTPNARDWVRDQQAREPEPAVRVLCLPASSDDALACLRAIEKRLGEMDTRLRHRQGMPEQEWFSIDEVAALTGLSADHVRRHVTSGTLPVCNQGTFEKPYYRIRRGDIDAWMAQRMQQPGPAARKKKAEPGSYRSRHHGKVGG